MWLSTTSSRPLRVEVERDRVNDVRGGGEQLDDEPRVGGDGRAVGLRLGTGGRCDGGEEKGEGQMAHGQLRQGGTLVLSGSAVWVNGQRQTKRAVYPGSAAGLAGTKVAKVATFL